MTSVQVTPNELRYYLAFGLLILYQKMNNVSHYVAQLNFLFLFFRNLRRLSPECFMSLLFNIGTLITEIDNNDNNDNNTLY